MDKVDKKLLSILQNDGRISNQDLADKVALSSSPCSRRVKILEDEGYIKKYTALLNPEKLGLQLTVIVFISLNSHEAKKMRSFEAAIDVLPEVIECYLIAGQAADYILKVIVPGLNEYRSLLLNKITCIEGVSNVHSSFVLHKIIDRTALPLDHLP